MKALKGIVWLLWTGFMMFIIYACIEISQYWFIGFLLWFIPAHYIVRWIEDGVIKEINEKKS